MTDKALLILQYIEGLETGDLNKMLDLFAEDGIVHSPLYGDLPAQQFYRNLFSDTQSSKVTLLNMLAGLNNPNIYGAHFRYDWTLKDKTATSFECVDIFVFNDSDKIKEMTIIYDTYRARQSFEAL